jgi:uncharacterized protein
MTIKLPNTKKIKKVFDGLSKQNSTPHQIALGFAIGTLIAILPTFGLGVFIGFLVIFIKKDINKLALFAALAIWNPIVLLSVNALAYQIGDNILHTVPVVEYDISFANQLYQISRRFLIGNGILAAIISPISYLIVRRIARKYKKL